jgi:hypothetical protein
MVHLGRSGWFVLLLHGRVACCSSLHRWKGPDGSVWATDCGFGRGAACERVLPCSHPAGWLTSSVDISLRLCSSIPNPTHSLRDRGLQFQLEPLNPAHSHKVCKFRFHIHRSTAWCLRRWVLLAGGCCWRVGLGLCGLRPVVHHPCILFCPAADPSPPWVGRGVVGVMGLCQLTLTFCSPHGCWGDGALEWVCAGSGRLRTTHVFVSVPLMTPRPHGSTVGWGGVSVKTAGTARWTLGAVGPFLCRAWSPPPESRGGVTG